MLESSHDHKPPGYGANGKAMSLLLLWLFTYSLVYSELTPPPYLVPNLQPDKPYYITFSFSVNPVKKSYL